MAGYHVGHCVGRQVCEFKIQRRAREMDLGETGRLGEISQGGGIKREEGTTSEVRQMMGEQKQWGH